MMKFLAILLIFTSCSWKSETPSREIASLQNTFENERDYCLSIRGNGQRMASLWGAITKSVESYGAPAGMSGGSSATYSMFLTESILMNPHYTARSSQELKEQQSLMLKSLMGQVDFLLSTPLFKKAFELADDPKTMEEVNKLMAQLNNKDASTIEKVLGQLNLAFRFITSSRVRKIAYIFGHADTKMLMNQEFFVDFLSAKKETEKLEILLKNQSISDDEKIAASKKHEELLAYRKEEFNKALKYFGNYNIKENANIFLRPGPLNFLGFANIFNRLANFYSGRGFNDEIQQKFENFLDQCSAGSIGKDWNEIAPEGSRCQKDFYRLAKLHAKEQHDHELGYKTEYNSVAGSRIRRSEEIPFSFNQRINDEIGKKLMIIPTTGLVIGESARKIKAQLYAYTQQTNPDFGKNIHADEKDLRIGYWGNKDKLEFISNNLKNPFQDALGRGFDFSNDYKSSLFYPLYKATWKEVFQTSPIEPSLSSIQEVPRTQDVLSIGGWMDHLSAPVLKAAGCPRVVTITKGDGLGKFATGMLKRILNLDQPKWEDIPKVVINGDSLDMDSPWGKYFNLANPKASFNTGLKSADAVICANYDLVDFKDGLSAFFKDGYNAPIAINDEVNDPLLKSHQFSKEITKADRHNQDPPYISCFPFE